MFSHPIISRFQSSPRARQLAMVALVASGCGRELDLGEIANPLEQGETASGGTESMPVVSSPLGGTPLLSSSDDIDVVVSDVNVMEIVTRGSATDEPRPVVLGDVDGDGYGDWIVGDTLFYGSARPESGRLEVGGRARFHFDAVGTFQPAGDVNGDGLMDILFGSEQPVWIASDAAEPVRELPVREPPARLLLGSRERLDADVELAALGLAFGDRDALISRLDATLASDPSDSFVSQQTRLTPLGDLNADGFADFVSTTTVVYTRYLTDEHGSIGGGGLSLMRESVSYLHHGARDLPEIDAPHARLDTDARWAAAGDVDGDGLRDAILTTPDAFYLLSGSALNAGGELGLERASEVQGITPSFPEQSDALTGALGDLDGDGYDDFALNAATLVSSPTDVSSPWWLFYGGPRLLSEPLGWAQASAAFETRLASSLYPLGDWDGDGRSDLVLAQSLWLAGSDVTRRAPDAREAVLLRGGGERFSGRYIVPRERAELGASTTTRELLPVPAGDLDGDGFTDMFVSGVFTSSFGLGIVYGAPLALELPH